MGKEKRLFLLAIMAVMISSVGYGAVVGNNKKPFTANKNDIKVTETLEVNNSKEEGYRLNAGVNKGDKTTVISNSKITTNEKDTVGIRLNVANNSKGENKLINNGRATITVNNGIGIDLLASTDKDGKNTVINKGKIIVNNGIGIKIRHNGTVTNEKEITVNNGIGIGVNNKTSNFYNSEKLNVTGGTGIVISNGNFTNTGKDKNGVHVLGKGSIGINQTNGIVDNSGLIKSDNGTTAIQLSNGTFNNSENGIIENSGNINIVGGNFNNNGGNITNDGYINISKNGKVNHSAGVVTNNNKMDITSSSNNQIGYEISGTGELVNSKDKTINITSSGKESIGINQKENGKLTNNGQINITTSGEKSIGIKLENIDKNEKDKTTILTNTGTIDINASGNSIGIKLNTKDQNNNNNKAEFNNEETINVNSGIGINVVGKNSTFTNTGTINVSGKDSVGIKTESNSFASNTKTINVTNGKYAVNAMSDSTFENTGTILSNKTAVTINDALFVNSGTIETSKKETAILSNAQSKNVNTVYLKDGSNITGKIQGAINGVDVLGLGQGTYNNLSVYNYDAISVKGKNVRVENSEIYLDYNKDIKVKLEKADKKMDEYDKKQGKESSTSGNLTIANTTLGINFKDSLTNKEIENPIIKVGKDGVLKFEKGINLVLDSSDGRQKFDISDALGFNNTEDKNGTIELGGSVDEVFNKTAIWNYYEENGHLIAEKENYNNVISKPQLNDFANLLDKVEISDKKLGNKITALETLKTQEEFTNAMTQMSGAVHGYVVDFAALNARTMVNTMRNRALSRDYMRKRPLNSWTQDVMYIDNNHRLGGLMDVNYNEQGVLGVSEKQILKNGRLGIVYGGSSGNAKFEGGENGTAKLDGAYFGGYYNHEFSKNLSLNSNANFVYTHNRVTRNVKFADINETFKSAYPTYTVGIGSSLIYTVKDDLRNKAHFYAGVDVERLMIGNINENKNLSPNDEKTGLAIKTTSYNPRTYYSIVPNAGFMVQNTGYVFDKKYRIGADLNWETEIGNIKDGKRLKITGIDKEYKVETTERENVFSYSLFGALDLTESLAVNAKYTSMFSDEYNADMIGAGFEYKMDTMADNFFGSFAHKLENRRSFSDRWGMTLGLTMEMDDVDDYTTYYQGVSSGDVATSMEYKPKLTLSINDKKSNWSYYFETYHKTNNMFGSIKSDEKESHASRIHGEARWNDRYSKGNYGMSFGYRNEFSEKSEYYKSYGARETAKTGTHELRLTPNFTYNIGNDFVISAKSAIVFMYKYEGDRAGQMDMNTESQVGLTYTGFMPRWSMTMNFYREDTWYDHSNSKAVWDKKGNGITGWDDVKVAKRDQVNQLRPSVTYYFGNGSSFVFDARIPLSNGSWANNMDGSKASESYESRYGFNYYFPVTPGFTANIGGTFLNIKTKNKDHSKGNYGNISRSYAFRPNIGFSYSF